MTDLPPFDGYTYDPEHDKKRLTSQFFVVMHLMRDEVWRTLDEIEAITGIKGVSASSRLRDFRKAKFGRHIVNRRPRGERKRGHFEYQLILRRQKAA